MAKSKVGKELSRRMEDPGKSRAKKYFKEKVIERGQKNRFRKGTTKFETVTRGKHAAKYGFSRS